MITENMRLIYHENLDVSIIKYLAEYAHIDLIKAMTIYYNSKLHKLIEEQYLGIENLSPQYLALDLIENEPQFFEHN